MSFYEDIRYLSHKEIDKKKWDQCIETADNSLIYAHSFYLDLMAVNWDALAWGEDYKCVMPLTWKSKFGIRYLYQPFLTAQLGVFGKELNPQMIGAFLHAVPPRFKLIEISLNNANHLPKHKLVSDRDNYVLSLGKNYENIFSGYNDNTKRNLKKAEQAGVRVAKNIDIEKIIELAIDQMKTYGAESKKNLARFQKLYNHLEHNKEVETYGVFSKEDMLIASAVFIVSKHRSYYILVGNHPDSKATGASHALIDEFIRDHAGQQMVLDFEGSDIPNLAFFYSGFGAVKETYPFLKVNRLPFYLKWFKK